jgi:hypothetical protein
MKTQPKMNAPEQYEIHVAGHLSTNWATRFEGMSIRHEPDGETVLSGLLDQSALHGVLVKIRDLGLKLISVNRTGTEETSKNKHNLNKGEMKNE